MKNNRFKACILAVSVIVSPVVSADWYDDLLQEWKDFAASTGEKKHSDWVGMLEKPEAAALARDWAAFQGYSVMSLKKEGNLPAELKPGLTITKDNMSSFPWLADYLPAASMDRLKSNDWFQWDEIVIIPSSSYHMPRNVLDATKEAQANKTVFNATDKGDLLLPNGDFALTNSAAIPFPKPKNGLELNWDFVANGVSGENFVLKPVKFDACNPKNKKDRSYEGHAWWKKFHGRAGPDVPDREGVIEGGVFYFMKPFDVRGLAAVRLRYADASKDDNFKVYLPGLRRTRVLSGSDGQDPMAAGLETTWDEWRGVWVKTNPQLFDYKIVGEGFVLAGPDTRYEPVTRKEGDTCNLKRVELELRPVWIMEINNTDGKYQYSKRKVYIDKEWYYTQYQEMYDQRGNLWRVWDDMRDFNPSTGEAQYRQVLNWNTRDKRFTYIHINAIWSGKEFETEPTPALFNIDQVRDYR